MFVKDLLPLKKRLVFSLKEDVTMNLYHRFLVNAIMAAERGEQFND